MPRQLENRIAAILVRVAHAVARVHAEGGAAARETQDAWQLMRLAPTLLLRAPAGVKLTAGDGANAGPSGPFVAQTLRLRCQKAECWSWSQLMSEYLEEMDGRYRRC